MIANIKPPTFEQFELLFLVLDLRRLQQHAHSPGGLRHVVEVELQRSHGRRACSLLRRVEKTRSYILCSFYSATARELLRVRYVYNDRAKGSPAHVSAELRTRDHIKKC